MLFDKNTIWTKQAITTLQWPQAFFGGGGKKIERFFMLDGFLRTGNVIEFGMMRPLGASAVG